MQVVIGDRRVPYLLRGSRPDTIVFLPALGTTPDMWKPQVDALHARYTVVVPDTGGHHEGGGDISLDRYAADVEAVLDAVGSTWVHVVGLSLGGMIAQHFALRYPERTRSLILVNTTAKWTDEGRQRLEDRAAVVEREGMAAVVDGILERWFSDAPFEPNSPGREAIRSMLLSADPHSYAAAARAAAQVDTATRLGDIEAETLVVRSELDASMPEDAASLLANRIPNAQLVTVPGLAHLCTVQAPTRFGSILSDFLHRVEEEHADDRERSEPAHPW